MGRVLTILAQPPDDAEHKEPDLTIEAVREKLEPFQSDRYSLAGASTVVGLGNVLKRDMLRHKEPPELVQIIGHGRPGVLFLGATWTLKSVDKLRTFVLECNLNKYGVLAEAVTPGTKVWLLGCRIGLLTSPKSVGAADGPALLFALHRMWGSEVSAPDHMVVPEDFVDGIYSHPECLVTARGLRVDEAPGVPAAPRVPNGVATAIR